MFKPHYKQLISVVGIELKQYAIASSIAFSDITSFPQLLRYDTDMVESYCVVPYLQCCYALVVMSNAVHDY